MNQLLKLNHSITLKPDVPCRIEAFLGGGGQGEVYKVQIDGNSLALKWYFAAQATHEQRSVLDALVQHGPPTAQFLWPSAVVESVQIPGFGYLMPLRESRFQSLQGLMSRKLEPSFRVLLTAAINLADSFHHLHAKGLCYRDIAFGNLFIDEKTGDILIIDNDNVTEDSVRSTGVVGTPRFMAPEIVRGDALPSARTDRYSLSVLLFYMLFISHPLEGEHETAIRCFDLPAMRKLYGVDPVFIFDLDNTSNRPVEGIHDNASIYWDLYPKILRDFFIRAFTDGLHNPDSRVRETEWRLALTRLRDKLLYCGTCGTENFYDIDYLRTQGCLKSCWNCHSQIELPPRIRFDRSSVVMLNWDARLYPHHVDPLKAYDFTQPVAEVVQHPQKPGVWGLKNLSQATWCVTLADGATKDIPPGKSTTLASGNKVHFGTADGEIAI